MRLAGLFSELALAFVGCGLALTAFGGTPNAEQSLAAGPPAQERAGVTIALPPVAEALAASADTSEHLQEAALSRWAAPAIVVRANGSVGAAASEASQPSPSRDSNPATSVLARPDDTKTLPATVVAAHDKIELAPVATAPIVPALALPSSVAIPSAAVADPDATQGGTPGLRPAKVLFGAVRAPAPLSARAIGSYSKGCLAGAQALPVDGPTWQAMRLSRNRNWGHPKLVSLIERLASDGKNKDGWPGLLVGDMAQPRGGPMLTGHASHQIGLDADIWLTPMPDRRLSNQERETIEATSMLGEDALTVNRDAWTDQHLNIIKRAASYSEVERIFVHPAIKQVLCYAARDDRSWLTKVRPYWGHYYHFHVRMTCPPGSDNCTPQKGVPGDDGCGKELDDWLKIIANDKVEPSPLPLPQPPIVAAPAKEKRPMTLDQLPSQCSVVLADGNPQLQRDIAAAKVAAEAANVAATKAALDAAKVAAAAALVATPRSHAAGAAAQPSAAPATQPSALMTPQAPSSASTIKGGPATSAKAAPKEKKTATE
jgi:penicillin-insensitive murein DD-endopeptidase